MKNILLILIIGMFLVSSVSALDSLGTFKQGEQVRISQVCSDATYINISSISYPNSSVAVSGIKMTSAGSGEFYYDFGFTNTNGKYDVRGFSDGCEKTFVTYFEITPDGLGLSIASIILKIFISLSSLIIMVFFLFMAQANNSPEMAKEESGGLRFLFIGLALIFLIAHIMTTSVIVNNSFGADAAITGIYGNIMYVFFTFLILAFLYTLFKVMAWEVGIFMAKKGLK